MNLQVFLEWFHRLDAALIGLSTLALAGLSWWFRRALPGWLPWASTSALALIGCQGILGGLTVTELLRFDIVTAHLGTALLFFSILIVIACYLTPYGGKGVPGKLSWFGLGSALLVYLQSLLGGLVGSRWAVHQCLNLSQLCGVMDAHILGVLPVTLAVLLLVLAVWRTPNLNPRLGQLAVLAGALVALQIALGVATLRLHLQVEPLTVAHHTVGAALLATLVAFSTFSFRGRLN